jgi:PKD repeat protein
VYQLALLRPNSSLEEIVIKKSAHSSRKHAALIWSLFLFITYLVAAPSQAIAQSRSNRFSELISNRTNRIQVSFTYSPAKPSPGQNVQFVDTSTNDPTSWVWSFGDGTTSSIQNPSHVFSAAGFYKVSLTAANSAGSKVRSRTITVLPVASTVSSTTSAASFKYSPSSPPAGRAVQFTDTSTNSPTSWQWHFGDGMISSAQNPTHPYGASGLYVVTLDASNSSGTKTASQMLTVTASSTPTASFTFSPASPAVSQAVQFTDTSTGSPTSWQWSFGDGSTSAAQNPSHTYTTAASYTVTLTATNSSGSQSLNRTVTVVPALAASFTFTPASPATGQAVQFTDTSTGAPTSWQWSFGDGSTGTAQNPSHTFATAGSYSVTLTVTNTSGSKNVSHTVTVAIALAVSFTFTPASPVSGQAVRFTDTSTGSPTSWQWSFGDGATSTAQNPSHTFTAAASYTVNLTATNSLGTKTASQTVTVSPSSTLSGSFSFSPASPVAGQTVQFTDTSTGSPTSWQWNFGDGSTSAAQNPSHTFAMAGSYSVTLTVTNTSGSKNVSHTVTVAVALAASFTFTPASPVMGQAVQFTDTSTGSPTSWQWSFGDSATSTAKNPSHTYTAVGSYNVTLTVSNSSTSNSVTQTISVLPSSALVASFTYSPASPIVGQAVQFTDTSTGIPASWQWDFGDGSSATVQNPGHTYAAAGSYLATLTIRTGSSLNNTSKTITVGNSNTITASSPSFADVSAAIALANPGDTIVVPAGTATWSSQLTITKPIKIIGAGVGNTIINLGSGLRSFVYSPARGTTTPFRFSGFQFNCNNNAHGFLLGKSDTSYSKYPITNVRVDHCAFYGTVGGGTDTFTIMGPVFGVADNNIITGGGHTDNLGQDVCDDWALPFSLGSVDNFYWEDNDITVSDVICTGGQGGRYCYRHNTFTFAPTSSNGQYPAFDMHGNQASGVVAGRGGEIYENTIYVAGGHSGRMFDHRGGTMVIYNNYYYYGGYDFQIREEHCNSITCSGAINFTVKDSYYWNNFNNGVLFDVLHISLENSCSQDVIKEGVNFWIHRASFNGTVGMGVGPLSARPFSGLVPGVGWWATDEEKLYRATSSTTWELYYTPYPYPHPLRSIL